MKKIFVALLTFCILLLSFGLTACGSTKAKINGIRSCVGLPENGKVFSSTLADETTLTENDYNLQSGKTYYLLIAYSASGGSRYPAMPAEKIKLYYDDKTLEIGQALNGNDEVIYYPLTCKKEVAYAAIIVEVDEYTYTVIINAK